MPDILPSKPLVLTVKVRYVVCCMRYRTIRYGGCVGGEKRVLQKKKFLLEFFFVRSQNLNMAWKRFRINLGEDRLILSTGECVLTWMSEREKTAARRTREWRAAAQAVAANMRRL